METEFGNYLDSLVGRKLFKEDQQSLVAKIQVKDNRGRLQKSHTQLNKYFEMNNIPYIIQAKRTNKLRYWEVLRFISFDQYLKEFTSKKQIENLLHKMSL